MTKFDVSFYDVKYKFHWWWYSAGGKELVVNITSTLGFFFLIYEMWFLAYLLEP
jgi:hypothetical protein